MKQRSFIISIGVMLLGLTTMAAGCSSKPVVAPAPVAPVATPPTVAVPNPDVASGSSVTTTPTAAPTAKPATKVTASPTKTPVVVSPKLNILRVNIEKMAFSPQIIAVNAGDTVQWVNKDTVPHTVTSDGALLWDSGTIQPGASFERQFKFAGSYPYHCGIHSTMKGTVVIH